ncbi:unnamed protein product, partial [marine sediment metagenome]
CDDVVVEYECDKTHIFYYFNARLKNCRICGKKRIKTRAYKKGRFFPCQIDSKKLPREGDRLLLKEPNLLKTFDGICIFEKVCMPRSEEFRALNPPKSISVKGPTGWTKSYAYRGRGGGGMMG